MQRDTTDDDVTGKMTGNRSCQRIILQPHQFDFPSRCHYQSWEIRKYMFGVAFHGMTSIQIFIRIRSAVLELLYADGPTKQSYRWNAVIRTCLKTILKKRCVFFKFFCHEISESHGNRLISVAFSHHTNGRHLYKTDGRKQNVWRQIASSGMISFLKTVNWLKVFQGRQTHRYGHPISFIK